MGRRSGPCRPSQRDVVEMKEETQQENVLDLQRLTVRSRVISKYMGERRSSSTPTVQMRMEFAVMVGRYRKKKGMRRSGLHSWTPRNLSRRDSAWDVLADPVWFLPAIPECQPAGRAQLSWA